MSLGLFVICISLVTIDEAAHDYMYIVSYFPVTLKGPLFYLLMHLVVLVSPSIKKYHDDFEHRLSNKEITVFRSKFLRFLSTDVSTNARKVTKRIDQRLQVGAHCGALLFFQQFSIVGICLYIWRPTFRIA